MGILIVVALFILILLVVSREQKKVDTIIIKRKEKKCPPHAWFTEEIRDEAGELVDTRLSCRHCGPYSEFVNKEMK
jgi:hypothetical protein